MTAENYPIANTNAEVHRQKTFGKLNDASDSDSSIEIFEGNLFAEKGQNETVKRSKPCVSLGSVPYPRFEMLRA
jgi:hypothetical protein